jgi:hypothetical protein
MKLQIIVFTFITVLAFNAIASWNPCISAKRKSTYRRHRLNSSNMDSCFESAVGLISNRRTKTKGINLISKFLYVKDSDMRISAILELGNSENAKAIKILKAKGVKAIQRNRGQELQHVTTALVSLNGYTAARDLAVYSRRKGKRKMMGIIRDEYLLFATGRKFDQMVAIAGEGTSF